MSTPFKVVILSQSISNLKACVAAIRKNEPQLRPEDIIVVWDGAIHPDSLRWPNNFSWVEGIKPFQFSRNANIGMRAAGEAEVILCCDDAILQTPGGFTDMAHDGRHEGITSASIFGVVANDNQKIDPVIGPSRGAWTRHMHEEKKLLCFICVLLPFKTRKLLGDMDERFTGYGYEDNDYSRRALNHGLRLFVHGCVVEHESQPSVWRTGRDISALLEHNRKLYLDKWGQGSL